MTQPLDLDARRRRAAYRATHRGTKEMDIMIGGYADSVLAGLADPELAHFERFLAVPEPELQKWLLDAAPQTAPEFADLVARVRTFNGLK